MQDNSILQQFYSVLEEADEKVLLDPKLFIAYLTDLSAGKVKNQKMLYRILENCVLPAIGNMEIGTAFELDRTSEALVGMIRENYPVSEDWAKEIAFSLTGAIKKHRGMQVEPFQPVSPKKEEEPAQPASYPIPKAVTSEKLHVGEKRGSSGKGWLITAAVLCVFIAGIVAVAVANRPGGSEADEKVFTYSDIIDQYSLWLANVNSSMEENELLMQDYYSYCYVASIPKMLMAMGNTDVTITYAQQDINNDGTDELIIADESGTIYDIFTSDGKNTVSLFGKFYDGSGDYEESMGPQEGYYYSTSLGYRQLAYIDKEGYIYHTAYAGTSNEFCQYSLPSGGTKMRVISGVREYDRNDYYRISSDGSEVRTDVDVYGQEKARMEAYLADPSNLMDLKYTMITP